MAFVMPLDPPTGLFLPNWFLNTYANNTRWLHTRAIQNWDTFTGCIGSRNGTIANGVFDVWRGWFVYQGVSSLLVSATGIDRIYIYDDSGEHYVGAGGMTGTLDISVDQSAVAMTYTVGKRYRVRVTVNHTGTSSWHVDYLAILTSNAYAPFPALASFTDGVVSAAADFTPVGQAEKYLNAMLTPMGSSCLVGCDNNGGSSLVFYNGGFYVRKLGATMQTTVNVTYRFQNGTATMKVYDSAGTLQDTISLTSSAAERTDSYTLTGTYTANTQGRITVESGTNTGRDQNYVKKVTVGGVVALTHAIPAPYASLDVVKGSSGVSRLAYIGNENLSDIRTLLRGATDNGFQYLAPDQTLGHIDFDLPSGVGYTLGSSSERDYSYRFLYYLPTAAGANGNLYYGTKNVALSDANNGDWSSLDLNSIADLAFGMSLKVDSVKACYQATS